jgi:hypothetical protein
VFANLEEFNLLGKISVAVLRVLRRAGRTNASPAMHHPSPMSLVRQSARLALPVRNRKILALSMFLSVFVLIHLWTQLSTTTCRH